MHSDLHQMTAFSCGFVHCSVFDRSQRSTMLLVDCISRRMFCIVLLTNESQKKNQLLGSTMLAVYCTGIRSCSPGRSPMALSAQGGSCSGFPVLHCPAPFCQEDGRLHPWGFCPQLGKAFAILVKGED